MAQLLLPQLTPQQRQVRLLPQQPSCGLAVAWVGGWLHPSVLPCALPCRRWCAGAHSTRSFSIICLGDLVGGPVPGLLRAVESLLQRQDKPFSVDISSGTCHSGI